jgi:hypothetical protein
LPFTIWNRHFRALALDVGGFQYAFLCFVVFTGTTEFLTAKDAKSAKKGRRMTTDPIVDEVRAARAAIAEKFGFDRTRFHAWAREETRRRQALRACQGTGAVTDAQAGHPVLAGASLAHDSGQGGPCGAP